MSDRIWIVRAGRDAVHIDDFRSNSFVALGWQQAGPIAASADDEEVAQLFERTFPDAKPQTRQVWQSQVMRFLREIEVGDKVATYDPNLRTYLIGEIMGEPQWREGPMPRTRSVRWTHEAARDELSAATRNSLGSIASLFRINEDASQELWAKAVPIGTEAAQPKSAPAPSGEAIAGATNGETVREDMVATAEQFIEDRIAALDWSAMQDLVAGILRAMGYKTTVSDHGSDRGVDIFASPDGLGLQEPRIFVEVKHRSGSMGADELRRFLGGRRSGDRCLYVSSGGFSREARYEAERSNVPLTLIDLPRLRTLLLQHYEALDPETRALVPLQKLYWPVD